MPRRRLSVSAESPDGRTTTEELLAEMYRERVLHTEDSHEGPRAFLEHRDPEWKCE